MFWKECGSYWGLVKLFALNLVLLLCAVSTAFDLFCVIVISWLLCGCTALDRFVFELCLLCVAAQYLMLCSVLAQLLKCGVEFIFFVLCC